MWASGRQATQRSRPGSTPSAAEVARAEARTASWVSTTPLGSPVVPLVATTSASPGSTGAPGPAVASVGVDDRRGPEGLEQSVARRAGAAGGRGAGRRRPASQAARRASTKAGPAGRSSATNSGMAGSLGDRTSSDSRSEWSNGCAEQVDGGRRPRPDSAGGDGRSPARRSTRSTGSGTCPLPAWDRRGDYRDIHFDVADGIAKLTINRPEVRNAFRPQTLFELADAFNVARDDPAVGVDHPDRRGPGRLLLRRGPEDPGGRRLHRATTPWPGRASAASTCSTSRSRSGACPSRWWPWWPATPSAAATSSTWCAT